MNDYKIFNVLFDIDDILNWRYIKKYGIRSYVIRDYCNKIKNR